MDLLSLLSTAVLVSLSIMGTLSHKYDDNLLQRCSMALICLGGSAELFCQWEGMAALKPRALLLLGCALFGLGSALKAWRYSRKPE